MARDIDPRGWETLWQFKTARFTVKLQVTNDIDPDLSWDENGETQEKVEDGTWGCYVFRTAVYLDGRLIGQDTLGNSVYADPADFAREHRALDPMHRNCSIMRAAQGNVSFCTYFTEMVRLSVAEARLNLANAPKLRA